MWEFLPSSNYLPLHWEPREGQETQFNYCTFYPKGCPVSWTENSVPQGWPLDLDTNYNWTETMSFIADKRYKPNRHCPFLAFG